MKPDKSLMNRAVLSIHPAGSKFSARPQQIAPATPSGARLVRYAIAGTVRHALVFGDGSARAVSGTVMLAGRPVLLTLRLQ